MDNGMELGVKEERRTWSDAAFCMLGFGQSDDAIAIDNECLASDTLAASAAQLGQALS